MLGAIGLFQSIASLKKSVYTKMKYHLYVVSNEHYPGDHYAIGIEDSDSPRIFNRQHGFAYHFYRGVPSYSSRIESRIRNRLLEQFESYMDYGAKVYHTAPLPDILFIVREEFERLRYTCRCNAICKTLPNEMR
jgi:hypothetical protein